MKLFIIIASALLSILSVFISPLYVALPLLPLLLYIKGIRLRPVIVSFLLFLSIPLNNLIVYGTVLELVLLSTW